MTVHAILETKGHQVVSVAPDATVAEAVKVLGEKRIGAILVMKGSAIEGILSERDVVRMLAAQGASILDEPVNKVMTRKVVTCGRTETVSGLMEKMTQGKFRHLPVVDEGRVIGIVSIGDVVKSRVMEYEKEQEALREYIKTA
jgi:CBS domain-containing protein